MQDRLDTLQSVREAGISVCAGGIIGLGEGPKDRVGLIHQLATLPEHPESVPINALVAVAGKRTCPCCPECLHLSLGTLITQQQLHLHPSSLCLWALGLGSTA